MSRTRGHSRRRAPAPARSRARRSPPSRAQTVRGVQRARRLRARLWLGSFVLFLLVTLAGLALLGPAAPDADARAADDDATPGAVWVTTAKGVIDPALSGYLVDVMEKAAAAQAAALVIQLDTPGGLDTSMREIIQAEIDSPVPVVFYVHPQGARAASAGVYILMGSDVAAMAPQTNLGAATPVSLSGDMDDTMTAKVTNDAAAYIIGLAETHGRNAEWAEQAVREAVSLPAEDALAQNVVDFVAEDLAALLEAIDGYVTVPKGLTLQTAGAPIHETEMSWAKRFLHTVANPDIAYILMTIGILGLITEISTPGLGAGGVVGVICLILAFYAFQVLPVSWAGIALIILALALFVAEIKVQSHGILGIGGTAAIILGGLLLFDTPADYLRVSWPVITVVAALVFLFFAFVVMKVARSMRRPHPIGAASLVGATGVTASQLGPQGHVKVHGEMWRARSQGEILSKNEPVEVIGAEGLTLVVRRAVEDAGVPGDVTPEEEASGDAAPGETGSDENRD